MKLVRFQPRAGSEADAPVQTGILSEDGLSVLGIDCSLTALLECDDLPTAAAAAQAAGRPAHPLESVTLRAPVEAQEIWAAGVTYLRSKAARMEESEFSATAYDRVYAAPRPELFFKALAEKAVGPAEPIGVRRDSGWTVPEPELALVLSSRGEVVGYTIANDVSARDIEGENLLYLPQAKIYTGSCAIGPWIVAGAPETAARGWTISLEIQRATSRVFSGEIAVNRIKRTFTELAQALFVCQRFPRGAVLLTGTGIVPPDDFHLQPGDVVIISVDGIGSLRNPVVLV